MAPVWVSIFNFKSVYISAQLATIFLQLSTLKKLIKKMEGFAWIKSPNWYQKQQSFHKDEILHYIITKTSANIFCTKKSYAIPTRLLISPNKIEKRTANLFCAWITFSFCGILLPLKPWNRSSYAQGCLNHLFSKCLFLGQKCSHKLGTAIVRIACRWVCSDENGFSETMYLSNWGTLHTRRRPAIPVGSLFGGKKTLQKPRLVSAD